MDKFYKDINLNLRWIISYENMVLDYRSLL